MDKLGVGRRPVLRGMLAVSAAAATAYPVEGSAASSHATPELDLNDKAVQSHIFRKLYCALDDRLGFWHLEAVRYGLVGAKLYPFWRMHIGSFFTTHDLPNGGYYVRRMGFIFYTDIDTGEYLRKFANPLTGKTIDILYGKPTAKNYAPAIPMKVDYMRIGGQEPPPEGDLGLTPIGSLGPAWIQSGAVWIQQDNWLLNQGAGASEIRYNDLTTYFGPLSDVVDPKVKMARAGHAFNDINNWPAWLEMGDIQGEYFSRGMGYKSFSYAEMPETWRKLLEQEYPEVAKNPLKALEA